MSPPGGTEAAGSKSAQGVKMCGAVILPAATVAGGWKNAQI
jgi:hypothetical protein